MDGQAVAFETPPRLWALSRPECLELLAGGSIGRLGLSIGALPVILPVNYVLVHESLMFRTVHGTKLDAATRNAVVAFEVDEFESDGSAGWSVLVRGIASEITDRHLLAQARSRPLSSWALDGLADHYVLIGTDEITRRRFDNLTRTRPYAVRT